jgi:hypothetical protein
MQRWCDITNIDILTYLIYIKINCSFFSGKAAGGKMKKVSFFLIATIAVTTGVMMKLAIDGSFHRWFDRVDSGWKVLAIVSILIITILSLLVFALKNKH